MRLTNLFLIWFVTGLPQSEKFEGIAFYDHIEDGVTSPGQTLYFKKNAVLFVHSPKRESLDGFTQELLVLSDSNAVWYRIHPELKIALAENAIHKDCAHYKPVAEDNETLHLYGETPMAKAGFADDMRYSGDYFINKKVKVLQENSFIKCLPYFSIMRGYLLKRTESKIQIGNKQKLSTTLLKSLAAQVLADSLFKIPDDYTIEPYSVERYSEIVTEYKFGIKLN